MKWGDDLSAQIQAEFEEAAQYGDADFDDGLRVFSYTYEHRPKPRKTWTDRSAYKAQKQREYKARERNAPPTEKTRSELAFNAEVRRRRKQTMRQKLAIERAGLTHHFVVFARANPQSPDDSNVREVDGYVIANLDMAGNLREIFVRVGKMGDFAALLDEWAIGVSICLQRGEPVKDLFERFAYKQYEPAGLTKNPALPRCSSLTDYIARWVLLNYAHVPNWEAPKEVEPPLEGTR